MPYFKTAQEIPGKGYAWTYYECDDQQGILRQLTHITHSGVIERIPDPIVKKLIRPELLQEASAEEFLALWEQ